MKKFVSVSRKFSLLVSGVVCLFFAQLALAETEHSLPAGEGRDLVINTCTVCHSDSIIKANRMTREGWDKTITWMQKQQGLWELDEKTRHGILNYLARHFGQDTSGKMKGRIRNPMYKHSYHPNPL